MSSGLSPASQAENSTQTYVVWAGLMNPDVLLILHSRSPLCLWDRRGFDGWQKGLMCQSFTGHSCYFSEKPRIQLGYTVTL